MKNDAYYKNTCLLDNGIEEYQRIFQSVIARQLPPPEDDGERIAILLGGQMGCGKTRLRPLITSTRFGEKPFVIIDPDDLRLLHPKYDENMQADDKEANVKLHKFASELSDDLIDWALKQGHNIVIDSTLRSPTNTNQLLDNIHNSSTDRITYGTEVVIVASNEHISRQNCLHRYWELKDRTSYMPESSAGPASGDQDAKVRPGYGRYTPLDKHDDAYKGIPLTLANIEETKSSEKVTVYTPPDISPDLRDISIDAMNDVLKDHLVYQNTLQEGNWINPPEGAEKLNEERERPFTQKKKDTYDNNAAKIDSWLTKYKAGERDKYLAKLLVTDFRLTLAQEEIQRLKAGVKAKHDGITDSETLENILAHHGDSTKEFEINDLTAKGGAIPNHAQGFCFGGLNGYDRRFVLVSKNAETGTPVYTIVSREQASHLGRMVMYEKDIKNRAESDHKSRTFKPTPGARNGVTVPAHKPVSTAIKSNADKLANKAKSMFDRTKGEFKLIGNTLKEAGEDAITKVTTKTKNKR